MKKGFAWLLCLIMMTGMLSSAASASSGNGTLTIDESSFVDANWENGSTPLPSFKFSIKYVKPSNRSSNNWTVEYHWYKTDANGKNPTKVNVQDCAETNGVPVKTLQFDSKGVATDTEERTLISAEEARKGNRYYCEVVIKHTSSQRPYNTTEYAHVTTQKKVKVVVVNEYQLLFDYPDGQVDKTVKVKIGEKAPVQADPTTTDTTKVFDKWVYQDTNEVFDFTKAVAKSGTLVPTWKDAPIPQVTYKYNGHNNVDETIPVGEDGMPKKLTPICGDGTNHRFIMWCKDEALKQEYKFDKEPKPTSNITLHALWGNVITFDLTNPITNEKIEIETQVVPKGEKVTEPTTVPAIEGYTFNGWKTTDGKAYKFNKGVGDDGFKLVGSWTKLQVLTLTTNDTVSLTYDGWSKEGYVSISGLDKTDKNCAQIVIKDSNGQEVSHPINAGTYTAQIVLTQQGVNSKKYVVDSNAGSLEFTIAKKQIEVEWKGLSAKYDGFPHKPTASLKNLGIYEQYAFSVTVSVKGGDAWGAVNAGKYEVTATISPIEGNFYYGGTADLNNYEFKNTSETLVIKGRASSIDAKDFEATYGDTDITVNYTATGCDNVTIVSLDTDVAEVVNGKINTLKKGTARIKLVNKADNYEESSKTIILTVNPKPVKINWSVPVAGYDWDGEEHCPTASVEGVLANDNCGVTVQGATSAAGTHQATAVIDNENYVITENETQNFVINKHVNGLTLVLEDYTTDYLITSAGVPDLTLDGIQYVVLYDDKSADNPKPVTSDMVTAINANILGTQAITVTYKDGSKEYKDSFDIYVKKELELNWNVDGLVYNGKVQGPTASVEGFDSLDGIITITFDGVNANVTHTATASLTEAGKAYYTIAEDCVTQDYTIAPAEVSVSWNYGNEAIKDGKWYFYYYDGNAHKPEVVLTGATAKECGLQTNYFYMSSSNVGNTDSKDAGQYSVSVNLENTNYTFKKDTVTVIFYSIYNKVDALSLDIRVPQCGENVFVNQTMISNMVSAGLAGGFMMVIADNAASNVYAVRGGDIPYAQIIPDAELNIGAAPDVADVWATVNGTEKNAMIGTALLPAIGKVTSDEDLKTKVTNAIDGLETIAVDGEKSYSILFVELVGSPAVVDTDAILNNIKASAKHNDKDVEVTINYVTATRNSVIVLVDVHAVHNFSDGEYVAPKEDEDGKKSVVCKLDGKDNHTDWTTIPALTVTKIEVLDGYKTGYFVGEAYDNSRLKIKVTLSDESTFEEVVTADMVSGFDSSSAGPKTLTITRKGKTVTFNVTVSKKKSSVVLKKTNAIETRTYGDPAFLVDFDATNDVVITSSNTNVAKIDEKNQVVIVGAGDAVITLKIADTDEVAGSETSFKLVVAAKVVGLSWSADNTFDEDGKTHCPTVKATELVGNDTCEVIVEGATAEAGTHTAKATGLSNPNYQLPKVAVSITFVIKAKEEPKKEDPKDEPNKENPKEEPKEEPKKEEPKFTTVITIGTNFKTVYDKGDKFDPTGLTIEVVNEKGEKTVVDVTEDMVKGFDSSKEGDIVITIQYKDASKDVPIKIVSYNIKVFFNEDGSLKIECHRSEDDAITFSLFLGALVDGKAIPEKSQKSWSGSLHMLVYADYIKSLAPGEHTLEILFKDGVAKTTFTVAAPAPSDASPVTGDTGNQMMWIILLAAAAVVLVVIRVYAAKRSNAE